VAPGHSRTTSRDRGAEALIKLIKGPPAPWMGFEMLWGGAGGEGAEPFGRLDTNRRGWPHVVPNRLEQEILTAFDQGTTLLAVVELSRNFG
jgi:hypothetical protein